MKVIKAYPPHFIALRHAFPAIVGRQGVLFSWGDVLYNPSGRPVSQELMAHEQVHGRRQLEIGTTLWWEHYIASPSIRLREELLAHRAEFSKFCERHPPGQHDAYRRTLAGRLSSTLYGAMITPEQAMESL